MMTAELKVNGALIGVIYLHNEGYVTSSDDLCTYHVEYWEPNEGVQSAEITHARSDGALRLVGLIAEKFTAPKSKRKPK